MTLKSFLGTLLTVTLSFLAGVFTALSVAPDLLRNLLNDGPLTGAVSAQLVAAGDLTGVASTRRAEGRAQLLEGDGLMLLRLSGLDVTHGPDLRVWLLSQSGVTASQDVRAADVTDLGPLEGVSGDQVLVVPNGVAIDRIESVAIWSASARTLYGVADFVGAASGGAGEISDG